MTLQSTIHGFAAATHHDRQGNVEGGALPFHGFGPDAPAVPLYELTGEVQSQTQAGGNEANVAAPKVTLKQMGQVLLRDADALILHGHLHLTAAVAQVDPDGPPPRTVHGGIVEQVDE